MISDTEKILKFENPVKKSGWLTRRSENLHMWRKRFYQLENNILKIGEDENFKDLKIVDLADYDIKWLDKFEKRYAVLFTATNKSVKYKYIYLGEETEAPGKELYEKIVLAQNEMKNLKDPNYKRKDNLETISSPTRAASQKLSDNEIFFTVNEMGFAAPEDVPDWVDQLCSTYELDKEDPLAKATESSETWKLVENKGNVKIFQEVTDPTNFKLFAILPKVKPLELLQLLVDLEKRPSWDETVESSRNISDIPSGHLAIIHRVLKPYGQITFARESYISRVIFNTVGKFFVLEKSLDDIEESQKPTTVPLNRLNINHSAVKVGAEPDGGSNLFILYSQQIGTDLTEETNTNLTLDAFKQIEKISEVDLDKVLTPDSREDFNIFLRHWKPKVEEEESKYDEDEKFLDEAEILKETQKSGGNKGNSKEFNEHLEKINTGKIARECVDPQVPYPDFSKFKDNKFVDKQVHWLLGSDFKRDPALGLEVVNQEWISSQKRVLSHIMRNMGKNLLEGKSIMNMSLPVSIFSKDSILQRAAKTITYAPTFVNKAITITDPLEQFKMIVTFYFTMLHIGTEQQKPFNPILGETYQGLIAGVPVILEQICHHPPISYLNYKTENYFIYGTYILEANAGANSITGIQKGRMNVQFPKVNEYSAMFPQANVNNLIMGKRSFNWSKKMKIFDQKNGFLCELHIYPDEKGLIGGLFSRKKDLDCTVARGKIWKVKKEYTAHLWDKHAKKEIAFDEKTHAIETLATVNGTWLEYLDIDNKRYWHLNDYRPHELVDQAVKVLPSDSTCRQDLHCRKFGEDGLSQEWKEKLENIQRNDRKLRQKAVSTKKK